MKRQLLLPLLATAMLSLPAMAQTTTTTTETDSEPGTQTRVEVRNETPAQAPQPPKINIQMPQPPTAPDIKVETPNAAQRDTLIERNETTIIDDTDDSEVANNNSVWMMAIIGVIGVFMIGMLVMAVSRRSTVDI